MQNVSCRRFNVSKTTFLARNYEPILKWAGSKKWAGKLLKALYVHHGHSAYYEPMCGGLGSALAVGATESYLSDLNPDLINLYQMVQTGFTAKCFGRTQYDYYLARDNFNMSIGNDPFCPRQRAELMYYLNRRGFRGLYRTNLSGKFNNPVGQPRQQVEDGKTLSLPTSWKFTTESYQEMMLRASGQNGLMVIDPPYAETGVKYGSTSFDVEDVLNRVPHSLSAVYFNSDAPEVHAALLRNRFKIYQISEPRSMNAGHGSCKKVILIAHRGILGAEGIFEAHGAVRV
jgi:DNA adenine methylase